MDTPNGAYAGDRTVCELAQIDLMEVGGRRDGVARSVRGPVGGLENDLLPLLVGL
ncbi:MAG TPA: hypothetical protein VFI46_15450 [Jiangellaceae bacterium]|nr:hypothetical protein [Jiangellaceae bacterium]